MTGNELKLKFEKQQYPQPLKDGAIKSVLSNFLPLVKLSATPQTDVTIIPDLSHALEVREFQLGDELLAYSPPEDYEQSNTALYLICAGRVRVLCTVPDQSREVSALVLESGETFGADHLFRTTLSSYRAIAASPCQIAQISALKLTNLLNQLPQLNAQLLVQVQRREYLIFFKTMTRLRSLSNRQIQQHVLAQLVEQRIKAGESIKQALAEDTGYFWLRSGRIQSQGNLSRPPSVGDSWGYPEPIPADWIAQTELLLYKRPLNAWERAKLLNLL